MTKFITSKELEDSILKIIWNAERQLVLISPYIKLDSFFNQHIDKHKNNASLAIIIVFGKNEHDKSKSLNQNDFNFFKSFPNISIIYEPKLHAKYYGNESQGVITSINLYDHSFKNNIEFGVLTSNGILPDFGRNSTDKDAWNTSLDIAHEGIPIFIRRPIFRKKLLLGKDYMGSKTLLDETENFYASPYNRAPRKKLGDFDEYLQFSDLELERPTRDVHPQKKNEIRSNTDKGNSNEFKQQYRAHGYCIRTGTQIPFNPQKPMCEDAFRSWNQYRNFDYPEKYCHKTGQKSHGKTSMNNPILD